MLSWCGQVLGVFLFPSDTLLPALLTSDRSNFVLTEHTYLSNYSIVLYCNIFIMHSFRIKAILTENYHISGYTVYVDGLVEEIRAHILQENSQ